MFESKIDPRALAKLGEQLAAIAPALEKVASLENAEKESKARLDALQKAEHKAVAAVVEAQAQARSIAEKTKADAEKLLADTRAACSNQVSEAQAKCDAAVLAAKKDVDLAKAQTERLKAEADDLALAIRSRKAEYASVEKAIAELKAKIL